MKVLMLTIPEVLVESRAAVATKESTNFGSCCIGGKARPIEVKSKLKDFKNLVFFEVDEYCK